MGEKQMAIEQLMQAVIAASPAKRRELERVLRGESADRKGGADDSRLVSVVGAARLLAIGRNTLYRLVETGRLDTVELNGHRRVTMRSIRQFLDGERPANDRTAQLRAEVRARYAAKKAAEADGGGEG